MGKRSGVKSRAIADDPRPSLEERSAAPAALVAERLLLSADAEAFVAAAAACDAFAP